jgi:hypothetical protein
MPLNLQGDSLLREMARRSRDKIAVYNPKTTDYFVVWDGYKHPIYNKNKSVAGEPNGVTIIERYLAEKYCREMKDILIHELARKEVDERNAALTSKGMPKMTPQEQELYEGQWKTTNPDLVEKTYKELWLGLVEEFGIDNVMETMEKEAKERDINEKIFEELSNVEYKRGGNTQAPTPPSPVKEQSYVKTKHDIEQEKSDAILDEVLARKKAKLVSEVSAK